MAGGIASSLRCGLNAVQKSDGDVDGIIFMVCDQPYVNGSLLESLLQEQNKTGLPIVASSYEENPIVIGWARLLCFTKHFLLN